MTENASNTYKLTLHIHHPTVPASEIEAAIDLPATRSRSAGEPTGGKSAEGIPFTRKENSVIFSLYKGSVKDDDIYVCDLIKIYLSKIDMDFTRGIVKSGGSCWFSLGIFAYEEFSFGLDLEVTELMSRCGIYINCFVYGDPD